jgi:large subunit ribosomal protein L1
VGKTKTAFVTGIGEEDLSGKAKYEQKKKQKEAQEKATQLGGKPEKVHIAGLKGGQRIKTIEAEPILTEEESESPSAKKSKGPKIRSKKYQEAKTKIDKSKAYSINDAIILLKSVSYTKFDSTVELHAKVKKEGLSVNIALPHSAGKAKRIEVADAKTLDKLKSGKVDFDVLLATADMMPKLVPFARLLGPKGLMPNPKNGTLIKSAKDAEKFSGNTMTIKTEKSAPLIHTTIGKVSQDEKELEENVNAIFDAVGRKQIERAFISSTMSPSIKISF